MDSEYQPGKLLICDEAHRYFVNKDKWFHKGCFRDGTAYASLGIHAHSYSIT